MNGSIKRNFVSPPRHKDATQTEPEIHQRKQALQITAASLAPGCFPHSRWNNLKLSLVSTAAYKRRYPPCRREPAPGGIVGEEPFNVLFQAVANLPLFEAWRGKVVDFGMLTGLQRRFQQGFPQASGTIIKMVPCVP